MASFALLLATPQRVTTWDFDGQDSRTTEHPEGTPMLTSGGPENRKADLHLSAFAEAGLPGRLARARPGRTAEGRSGRAGGPARAGRAGLRNRLR